MNKDISMNYKQHYVTILLPIIFTLLYLQPTFYIFSTEYVKFDV